MTTKSCLKKTPKEVMKVRLVDYSVSDPYYNMAVDEAISISVRERGRPATFRFYGWSKPAVTIGTFQKTSELNLEFCRNLGIPVIRRPTGGKGIFHFDDLTYSFSSRNDGFFKGNLFHCYSLIAQILFRTFLLSGVQVEINWERRGINKSSHCFDLSSFGEISIQGKKIVGSAQRRWRDGFLQQGTIPLQVERDLIGKIFRVSKTESFLGLYEIDSAFSKEAFIGNFKEVLVSFGFQVIEDSLLDDELELVESLLVRYQSSEWLLERV